MNMEYLRMEDELLLDNDGPLLYQGKDLRVIAESLGISVIEIRRVLGISITEVQLLTTVGELQDAYQLLFSGEKKSNVIERMERHFRPKLEEIPKDMDHFYQIINIRDIVFNENPIKNQATDWINKIASDFLRKAKERDLVKIGKILQSADLNYENRTIAKSKYAKFQSRKNSRLLNKDLAKIKRTESLEGLKKLVCEFHFEVERKALEKLERRCREEIKKAAISKDYKKAKDIYVLSHIFTIRRFGYPNYPLRKEIIEVWKKICLEAEDEKKILEHLWERDYDGQSDDLTIQPGAFEILDEIYVRKIEAATTLEKIEQLEGEAPRRFMMKSKSEMVAKEKRKIMIMEKVIGVPSELKKIYHSPWVDNEIKKVIIEGMLN